MTCGMESLLKNIIIAEDDLDDVELFTQALTEVCPGFNLSKAENGDQLMRLLDENEMPDMIVLDLNMPYKSGKECLKEIRLLEKFDDVPIVILSTSKRVKELKFSFCQGLNYFFMKPWSYNDLRAMIKNLCQGRFADVAC
jgi:DNA-binding response OmpR family regulator